MNSFWLITASAAAIVLVLMVTVAVGAKYLGRINIIDAVWGPGFVLVAVTSAVVGQVNQPFSLGRWIVVVLVTVWGGRLGWHLFSRDRGRGEDPRYTQHLAGGRSLVRAVLLPQGAAIWFVSLPVQIISWNGETRLAPTIAGVVLCLTGLVFEAIGDAQLARFKADSTRGPIMDRGLWAWTRHPNYFGDACFWWGIWLIAASSWAGAATILSPAAMTYFLVFATGVRLLERTMMDRPGYREYAQRTSMFIPLPPRRR